MGHNKKRHFYYDSWFPFCMEQTCSQTIKRQRNRITNWEHNPHDTAVSKYRTYYETGCSNGFPARMMKYDNWYTALVFVKQCISIELSIYHPLHSKRLLQQQRVRLAVYIDYDCHSVCVTPVNISWHFASDCQICHFPFFVFTEISNLVCKILLWPQNVYLLLVMLLYLDSSTTC